MTDDRGVHPTSVPPSMTLRGLFLSGEGDEGVEDEVDAISSMLQSVVLSWETTEPQSFETSEILYEMNYYIHPIISKKTLL